MEDVCQESIIDNKKIQQYDWLIHKMIRGLGHYNNLAMSLEDLQQEGRKEIFYALQNFYKPEIRHQAWINHHVKYLKEKTGAELKDCSRTFIELNYDLERTLERLNDLINKKELNTNLTVPYPNTTLRPFSLGCELTYVYRHLYFRFGNLFHRSLTIYSTIEKHKTLQNFKQDLNTTNDISNQIAQGQNINVDDVMNLLQCSSVDAMDNYVLYNQLIESLQHNNKSFNTNWLNWKKLNDILPTINRLQQQGHNDILQCKIDECLAYLSASTTICQLSDIKLKINVLHRYYTKLETNICSQILHEAYRKSIISYDDIQTLLHQTGFTKETVCQLE